MTSADILLLAHVVVHHLEQEACLVGDDLHQILEMPFFEFCSRHTQILVSV